MPLGVVPKSIGDGVFTTYSNAHNIGCRLSRSGDRHLARGHWSRENSPSDRSRSPFRNRVLSREADFVHRKAKA